MEANPLGQSKEGYVHTEHGQTLRTSTQDVHPSVAMKYILHQNLVRPPQTQAATVQKMYVMHESQFSVGGQ